MIELEIFEREEGENNREYSHRLLRSNIMTLRLQPGTIIKEGEISEILGMSRTPVHEAITTLKEEWLIEVAPQSGTKVSLINPALMREGYGVRLLLESALLEEYAGKLTREQSTALLTQLKSQEKIIKNLHSNPDLSIRLDDEFHHMLYQFSGREHTWQALKGLVSHYDRARYLHAIMGQVDANKILKEHREIYGYMLMGLPPQMNAKDVLSEHMGYFGDKLYSLTESYEDYFIQ